jgi:hypothetical protein
VSNLYGRIKPVTVILANKGSRWVRITAVKSLSAQITADADKKILNPGESASITVAVTPGKNDRLLSGYVTIIPVNLFPSHRIRHLRLEFIPDM